MYPIIKKYLDKHLEEYEGREIVRIPDFGFLDLREVFNLSTPELIAYLNYYFDLESKRNLSYFDIENNSLGNMEITFIGVWVTIDLWTFTSRYSTNILAHIDEYNKIFNKLKHEVNR